MHPCQLRSSLVSFEDAFEAASCDGPKAASLMHIQTSDSIEVKSLVGSCQIAEGLCRDTKLSQQLRLKAPCRDAWQQEGFKHPPLWRIQANS
eukprot:2289966-Amphidinium_carterae.1